MQPKKQGYGKKSKRKDERPARSRYWAKRQLEKRKVKNLMKYCHMTAEYALTYWRALRRSRIPTGFNK